VNFGDILERWEKQTAGTGVRDAAFGREEAETPSRGERRFRLLRKKPDSYIDLHGLSRDEAWTALGVFFENSRKNGCEKVLVIHGKGNMPMNEGVLRELSRRFIESCPFAGESGYSSAKDGGAGATWVILKDKL